MSSSAHTAPHVPIFPQCYCQIWPTGAKSSKPPIYSPSPWYSAATLQKAIDNTADAGEEFALSVVDLVRGCWPAPDGRPAISGRRNDAAIPAMVKFYEQHPVALQHDIIKCCLEEVPSAVVAEALDPPLRCADASVKTAAVWLKIKRKCKFFEFPGLREILVKKLYMNSRTEGYEAEDVLRCIEAGCYLKRAVMGRVTAPGHPLLRAGIDVGGLFTVTDVQARQLVGVYSGALMPNRVLDPYARTLPRDEQEHIWTYDYEAPRLFGKDEYLFFGASVRNDMCSANDYHGIQDDPTLHKVGIVLGGLLPLVLLVAKENIPAGTEAVLSYGTEWRNAFVSNHEWAKDIFSETKKAKSVASDLELARCFGFEGGRMTRAQLKAPSSSAAEAPPAPGGSAVAEPNHPDRCHINVINWQCENASHVSHTILASYLSTKPANKRGRQSLDAHAGAAEEASPASKRPRPLTTLGTEEAPSTGKGDKAGNAVVAALADCTDMAKPASQPSPTASLADGPSQEESSNEGAEHSLSIHSEVSPRTKSPALDLVAFALENVDTATPKISGKTFFGLHLFRSILSGHAPPSTISTLWSALSDHQSALFNARAKALRCADSIDKGAVETSTNQTENAPLPVANAAPVATEAVSTVSRDSVDTSAMKVVAEKVFPKESEQPALPTSVTTTNGALNCAPCSGSDSWQPTQAFGRELLEQAHQFALRSVREAKPIKKPLSAFLQALRMVSPSCDVEAAVTHWASMPAAEQRLFDPIVLRSLLDGEATQNADVAHSSLAAGARPLESLDRETAGTATSGPSTTPEVTPPLSALTHSLPTANTTVSVSGSNIASSRLRSPRAAAQPHGARRSPSSGSRTDRRSRSPSVRPRRRPRSPSSDESHHRPRRFRSPSASPHRRARSRSRSRSRSCDSSIRRHRRNRSPPRRSQRRRHHSRSRSRSARRPSTSRSMSSERYSSRRQLTSRRRDPSLERGGVEYRDGYSTRSARLSRRSPSRDTCEPVNSRSAPELQPLRAHEEDINGRAAHEPARIPVEKLAAQPLPGQAGSLSSMGGPKPELNALKEEVGRGEAGRGEVGRGEVGIGEAGRGEERSGPQGSLPSQPLPAAASKFATRTATVKMKMVIGKGALPVGRR